jgi:hypothetical protein
MFQLARCYVTKFQVNFFIDRGTVHSITVANVKVIMDSPQCGALCVY